MHSPFLSRFLGGCGRGGEVLKIRESFSGNKKTTTTRVRGKKKNSILPLLFPPISTPFSITPPPHQPFPASDSSAFIGRTNQHPAAAAAAAAACFIFFFLLYPLYYPIYLFLLPPAFASNILLAPACLWMLSPCPSHSKSPQLLLTLP